MSANTVVSRMIWKEFFALRMVWVLCVLGVLALNAFLTLSAKAYDQTGYSAVFWALAIVVPAAYVVACTAMTFAGEREERTSEWLVALAPPFAPLYVSKHLFVLLSGLAMQLFLAAAAACFMLADRAARFDPIAADDVWGSLAAYEFVFLECLAWGVFWSLQTAKPVQAIFKTIATLIVIFVISGFSLDWARHHGGQYQRGIAYGAFDTWGWLRTSWTLAVMIASMVLGQRWLNGRAFEWETVFARLFRRRLPKARIATRERAEPWQRTWQRLWWLEAQSLKSFAWMTVAAAVLSCVSILFGERPTLVWMTSFLFLLVLIAGLQTWRGEQSRHQYRLLVNYGASPAALWSNKLLMWFAAAVLATVVVGGLTVALWTALWWTDARHLNQPDAARWRSLFPLERHFNHNPTVMWQSFTAIGLYGLMLFTASFTWSLLSRKAVIAFGLSLITLLALTPWFFLVPALGMPMGLFLAPIPVWLLWVSWRHLKAWWLEQSGWRVWLVRGLELAVVPAVLGLGAIAYRVYEIPWIPDAVAFRAQPHPLGADWVSGNKAAWQRVTAAVKALPPLPREESGGGMAAMSMEAADVVDEEPVASAIEPENGDKETPALNAWLDENTEALERVQQEVTSTGGFMVPDAAIWEDMWASTQRELAIQALVRQAVRTVSQDHHESVEWLQSAVRLAGAVRRYAPWSVQRSFSHTDERLFADMVAWAQHPDQTEETLRAGLAACVNELKLWQNTVADVEANLHWERKQTEIEEYWPWEEARRQRLLQIAAINQTSYVNQVQSGFRPATLHPQVPFGMHSHLTAWQVRPAELLRQYGYPPESGVQPVVGLDPYVILLLHDAETRYRATVTTMAVVGYRQLHGRLPASLTEVAGLFGDTVSHVQNVLTDPWSQEWFHYEPTGFLLPPDSTEVLLRQPLLWSGGPNHYSVQPLPVGLQVRSRHSGYAGILTDRNERGLYLFPIPPQRN